MLCSRLRSVNRIQSPIVLASLPRLIAHHEDSSMDDLDYENCAAIQFVLGVLTILLVGYASEMMPGQEQLRTSKTFWSRAANGENER